jgi:hypothetical protein
MILCQGYMHVLKVWPCFKLWDTFLYQGHVSISMFQYQVLVFILNPFFKSNKCFSSLFLVYIKVYFLFLELYVYVCICSLIPSIQKTFTQNLHRLFAGFYISCPLFLTCVTFSLVLLFLCFAFLGYF